MIVTFSKQCKFCDGNEHGFPMGHFVEGVTLEFTDEVGARFVKGGYAEEVKPEKKKPVGRRAARE